MPQHHGRRRVAALVDHVVAQHAPAAPAPPHGAIDEGCRARFEQSGFLRLPGYFSADELAQMTEPINAAHSAGSSPVLEGAPDSLRPSGSASRFNYPDIHTGCTTDASVGPKLAEATVGNHRLVAAVETVLGQPAEVAQFGSLLTKPGDEGALVHFDYKPFRVLGSSLQWLVVVIPLTDYTAAHGPLMVSPGAHRGTRVLPSANKRVHPVEIDTIPPQPNVPHRAERPIADLHPGVDLIDPQLRRGDMFFFNGFTWHFAAPNCGPHTRLGLYIKFRAKSAPSSCGPLLFPSHIARLAPRVLPHHREDGTQTIDRAIWILEDGVSHDICVLDSGHGACELPGLELGSNGPMRVNDTGAWDLGNVIGACLRHAESTTGRQLGWLSWVTDHKTEAGTDKERVIRVYGHISSGSLAGQEATLASNGARMVRACVGSGLSDDQLRWVRCWQESRDVAGTPVRRGFGFALDRGHEMEGWQRDDGATILVDANGAHTAE